MKTLLVINSSGRTTRSITRHLTRRFTESWLARHHGGSVIDRDVGLTPPPPVDESWIAAAFTAAEAHEGPAGVAPALAVSESLIAELEQASLIVVGAPMYNFGMPAALKAYIDQVVRVGRTFAFDPSNSGSPYEPLLAPKPVVLITSAGDGALQPGGSLESLNFLEPHLKAVFGFIGLDALHMVRAGYDEYQDDRFRLSMARAEGEVDHLASLLA